MTNETHTLTIPYPLTTTSSPNRSRRGELARVGAALAAITLTAGLSACNDGDAEAGAVTPAACDAVVALGSVMSQAPQDPSQFAAFAENDLVPIGATLVAEFDGDAKASAETLHAAYQSVAETGDPTPLFEDPDVAAASGEVGKLVHDECDVDAIDVEAIEYAFVGVPEQVDAGRVSFAFENTGVEEHEMVLFRRNDGVTETLDELLELPEDELMAKMSFTGVTFGSPGTTNYSAMDLEPGTYFLICFIPQDGDGAPHFMGGMKETIEVS